MNSNFKIQILRSKLIAMTRVTQRAVDYSIKALQLGKPELCRAVFHSKDEMSSVRSWIAKHGTALLDTGQSGDDSRFVCAALRIAGALEVAYSAATEIAQRTEKQFATGWVPISAELANAGQFVNSLLRMCVVSLFTREAQHAKRVLENGATAQSLDVALYLAHHHTTHETSAQVRFEMGMIRHLERIAEQTREVADAITVWLEGNVKSLTGEEMAQNPAVGTARWETTSDAAPAFKVEALSKTFVWVGSSRLQVRHLNSSSERSTAARNFAEDVAEEDSTPARLMRLQQRVCELLAKNQQLRMALMAQRAEALHDHVC